MELLIEKWNEILLKVKEDNDLTDVSYKNWIEPLQFSTVQNNTVYVIISGDEYDLKIGYIKRKYYMSLKVIIAEVTGIDYNVEFISPDQSKKIAPIKKKPVPTTVEAEKSNLNPNYKFETFVVGGNNRFAHSASLAVAESPGEIYNPLFIYGGVGLGKTHLMHSIAHFINETQPDLKVLYVSSETFTNDLIEAIRYSTNSATSMAKFREKYRNVDVLLVDDVQFIIGKDSTQEEFFHTFNELHTAKKQIIISSDKPPKEMEILEERIKSRFEWGLIADIGSPDYETRMAILRKKAEEFEGSHIDDSILNYIAINIKSNIRELEGALNKLIAYSNLVKTEITMDIAVKELQNLIAPDSQREITPQLIIEVVSEHFNITVDQIMSKTRSKDIAEPRQVAMYLCRNLTDIPVSTIGKLIGGRDHSTVLYGVEKVSQEMSIDPEFKKTVETIRKKINPN